MSKSNPEQSQAGVSNSSPKKSQTKERKLNPEHVKEVLEIINQGPYFRLLDIDIEVLDMGYCRVSVNVSRKHNNCFGGIHGGAYASILDTAAYWALYCEMPENAGFTSLDLQTNNFRSITEGHVVCEARVIKRGSSICFSEATIVDDKGRLMAQGTSKIFVAPTLQPISAAIETLCPGRELPPKFLEG